MNKKFATAVVLGISSLSAFAQANAGPDVSAIEEAAVTVGAIGAAVFAVMVGIKVWKWARRSL